MAPKGLALGAVLPGCLALPDEAEFSAGKIFDEV